MQFVSFQMCDSTSTPPQAPLPLGKCFVYLTGTATLAQLYDGSGSPISNPVIADTNAMVGFAAADGIYDYQFAYPSAAPAGPKVLKQGIFDFTTFDGIPADSTGAVFNNSTDDHVGIIAAFTKSKSLSGNTGGGGFYKGGPKVKFPAGKTGYMATNALDLTYTTMMSGHGAGRHGPEARGVSALRFAAGSSGIRVQAANTSGDTAVDGSVHDGSGGLNLQHLMLQGPEDGVEASVDGSIDASLAGNNIGVDGRKQITGYDLYVRGFRGIGIKGWAGNVHGVSYAGDVSLTAYYATKVENCQINWHFAGSDANIITLINCEALTGTQAGFVFDLGIGPAVGIGLHAASNGLVTGFLSYMCHHNGDGTNRRYAAVFGKTIAQLTANAPPNGPTSNAYWYYIEDGGPDSVVKTWNGTQQFRAGGDYITAGPDNPFQVATFFGLYSENPGISQFGSSTLLYNSDIAAKYRKGGVHLYANNGSFNCDENAHFGGNLVADGTLHTFGNNAGSGGATTVNFDTAGGDVGAFFRGPGAAVWGYLDFASIGMFGLAGSSSGWNFRVGTTGSNVTPAVIDPNGIYPGTDNTYSCGKSGSRWSVVYAGSGTINTSDERHKLNIAAVDDRLLDAWSDVEWSAYQMRDAVAAKGKDGARIHIGLVAQRALAIFVKHKLDGFRLGLFCFDKWEDEFEPEFEIKTIEQEVKIRVDPVYEGFDWVRKDHDKYAEARKGFPGKWVRKHKLSEEQRRGYRFEKRNVEVHVPKYDERGAPVMRLKLKAGEIFGVRYEEALALEAALQRRERSRLEARVAKIEKLLAA